ncbi:hypothetical protein CQA61_30275, partial [Klebsiella pneumoniae]
SLIAQQQTVPDWAIGWVISSFIALKQIEPALTLIHQPDRAAADRSRLGYRLGHLLFYRP